MTDEKDLLLDFGCVSKTLQYLGDGVYAGYDGAQIWLICRRDDDFHYIALEPQTFESLAKMGQSYHYIKLREDS